MLAVGIKHSKECDKRARGYELWMLKQVIQTVGSGLWMQYGKTDM